MRNTPKTKTHTRTHANTQGEDTCVPVTELLWYVWPLGPSLLLSPSPGNGNRLWEEGKPGTTRRPPGPSESLHIYSHSCGSCSAVQNAARGQTAAAFAIRHVASPCVSREESHPATISSSSLCLAASFSFPSSTQRLLSERIKNWYCSFHVEIHFSQARTCTRRQTHTLLCGFWWTFQPEWFQKGCGSEKGLHIKGRKEAFLF